MAAHIGQATSSPSTNTASSNWHVGDRNWMKLTANSGSRRIDSVYANSGTTVTTPPNTSNRLIPGSVPKCPAPCDPCQARYATDGASSKSDSTVSPVRLSTGAVLRTSPYTPNVTGRATASQVNSPFAANGTATPAATRASAG